MVKHIVMWKFKNENGKKEENMKKAKAGLEGLAGKIDGLLSIRVGVNFNTKNVFDMVLETEHVDEEALDFYQKSPAHLEVATFIRSVVEDRACTDYLYWENV